MVISPFSKTGVVVHDFSDHGSVSKLIEDIFGLPTFGSLPDERKGVSVGLSPADGDRATSNLFDALDESKLHGGGTNPPSLAEISSPSVPPNMSCSSLGIAPIPSPTSLPNGFETAGWYLAQQLEGSKHHRTHAVCSDAAAGRRRLEYSNNHDAAERWGLGPTAPQAIEQLADQIGFARELMLTILGGIEEPVWKRSR